MIHPQTYVTRILTAFATPLAVAAIVVAVPSSASASNCAAWTGIEPTNPGGPTHDNRLDSVAVLSRCNAWTVGAYSNGTASRTLIEHWNGRTWKYVASPNTGSPADSNFFSGIAMQSSRDGWAVGEYDSGTVRHTLTEHWNGTAWKLVTSPNFGGSTRNNELIGVTALSPSNAWAVGYYYNGTTERIVILHWTGSAWKHVTSPNPGINDSLSGVTAVSRHSIWTVGSYFNGTAERTLIEHWNGTRWKHLPSPNVGPRYEDNELADVTTDSSTSAWAVGYYTDNYDQRTLVLHWNGRVWKHVASPKPGSVNENSPALEGVTAPSSRSAWTVGSYDPHGIAQTLILHWNGRAWKQVASANPGGSSEENMLGDVAATSPSNVWAVGDYYNGTAYQTMAVHCC